MDILLTCFHFNFKKLSAYHPVLYDIFRLKVQFSHFKKYEKRHFSLLVGINLKAPIELQV